MDIDATDRALMSGDYEQAVALAAPPWSRRPDDWRGGDEEERQYRDPQPGSWLMQSNPIQGGTISGLIWPRVAMTGDARLA